MKAKRYRTLLYLSLALLVVIIDRWSKGFVRELLSDGATLDLLPFLDLVLIYNQGAAFGFLAKASGWQTLFFIVVGAIISIFIVIRIIRFPSAETWLDVALVFILGGAVGNLIDRIRQGYVVDFIELHYGGFQFPAFNVADMAIFLGATILVLDLLRISPRRKSGL